MNRAQHAASIVVLALGVGLEVLAVLGATAMRDALDRLHYVGVAGFGALVIAVSILIREGFSLIADKALLIGVVLIAFGPVLAHVTARSYRARREGSWNAGIERYREEERK